MNKQKILVAAEIFSANLGDYAIYDSIKSILLSKNVQVIPLDISGREGWSNEIILNNKKSKSLSGFIKYKALTNRIINRIYSRILWEMLLKRHLRNKWEKLVNESQLVIIGGGQLITDSNANFFYKIKEIASICQKLNKPFVFMGCGAGENMSRSMLVKYSQLINKSNFISFRDYQSLNVFKPYLGESKKAYVFPDFAFSFSAVSEKIKNDKILGVNIIPLNNFKIFNTDSLNLNDEVYLSFWLKICQGALNSGYRIKIITNGHIEDYKYANKINEYLKENNLDVEFDPKPNTPEDLYNQINSVDYVLATRMHAGIIAKALGKNSVTLIWDNKILNVWKAIGMENSTINYKILNSENSWNTINEKLNSLDQEEFDKELIVQKIEMSLDMILDIIR